MATDLDGVMTPSILDLYSRCFPDVPKPAPVKRPVTEPREIFARVLRQIETMELRMRVRIDMEREHARGYVFAIGESGSDFVTIGHASKSTISGIMRRLQAANPRPLKLVAMLNRYSFDDARELCALIKSGVTIYQCANPGWITMENGHVKIAGMFARIDRIDSHPDLRSIDPPELRRG